MTTDPAEAANVLVRYYDPETGGYGPFPREAFWTVIDHARNTVPSAVPGDTAEEAASCLRLADSLRNRLRDVDQRGDLDVIQAGLRRIYDRAMSSPVPGDTATEDVAQALNAEFESMGLGNTMGAENHILRRLAAAAVRTFAAAGLLAPAGTEGARGLAAAPRPVAPVGNVDRDSLTEAFMAEWRGAGYVNRAEGVPQPSMEACARLAANFALAALRGDTSE